MRRLDIGLVTPGFSAGEDDWCIPALRDLVRILARDHRVTVYTLRYPHRREDYGVFGATVRAFGGATAGGLQRVPLLAQAAMAIWRDSRRRPFSVLHGVWADEAGFTATLAGRLTRTPVLVSLMGGELVGFPDFGYGVRLSRSGRLMTGLALRLADSVSAGSRHLQEMAAPHTGGKEVRRLTLGTDTDLFRPGNPAPRHDGLRVLHVASLSAVKDQATLLEAFAGAVSLLEDEEATLHIIGDGPLEPALREQAQALGIDGLVHFHGEVPHERLPDVYRAADLFVLTSRYESQSVAVLEAAACGLPVVGTATGILPELLPPRSVAPAGDAAALARILARLLRDGAEREKEGQRLSHLVTGRYSLEKTVPQLLDTYLQMMNAEPQLQEKQDG